jgi:hypothetical protein
MRSGEEREGAAVVPRQETEAHEGLSMKEEQGVVRHRST